MDNLLLRKIVKPIYIRIGPGRSYDALAPIYPSGKDLLFDGLEIGESWKGINEWFYKINDKNEKQYYWKGGTKEVSADLSWGIRVLGIDQVWKKTRGAGVKIAILDTGIDLMNNDLKSAVVSGFNVITHESYPEVPDCIQDTSGHGTMCASVIVARELVKGIAPDSNLIVIKMIENDKSNDITRFLPKAIEKAVELGADVISMSFVYPKEDEMNNEITSLIKNLWNDHLFVAAAGNDFKGVYKPANIPGIVTLPDFEPVC